MNPEKWWYFQTFLEKVLTEGFLPFPAPTEKIVAILSQGFKRSCRYRLTCNERFAVSGIDALAEVFCGYFYSFEEAASADATAIFELVLVRFYGG